MNIWQCIRVALESLIVNKLRASLTMLGVIIGVTSVIVLVSVGHGLEKYISDQFTSFGANVVYVMTVRPGENALSSSNMPGYTPTSRDALGLSNADVEALLDAPDVVGVAPSIERPVLIAYSGEDKNTFLLATTAMAEEVLNWHAIIGRFITEEDVMTEARVVVLGQTLVEYLFPPGVYPIGESVRINDVSFRVVGILEEKGGMLGVDADDYMIVPVTTAQSRLFDSRRRDGEPMVDAIQVMVSEQDRTNAAVQQVTDILRERHNIQYRNEEDFQVISQDEFLVAFKQITGAITVFLGLIAGISLLVGGIGIMNIMLVSVTERTREIGLRKAVGAKKRDILVQFLVEAIVLAVVGGLAGVALGAAGAALVSSQMEDFSTVVTLDAVLMATIVSASVGIFFGIYPAWRAAQLNPIDALRYE
jgi:putative ABC transport system permease protein